MDDDAIKRRVQAGFARTADQYVNSPTHARGPDLPRLAELAQTTRAQRALDVATGAGHTLLALAPHVREAVACDLTPEMLATARRLADQAGCRNATFVAADVEALPFASASFDVVTCRIAAHHFPRPDRAVAEMARVLRPDGLLLLVDNVAPADPALDAWINQLERVRDPGHVRALPIHEWLAHFAAAGLAGSVDRTWNSEIDFDNWVQRAGGETRAAIEQELVQAPAAAVADFQIRRDPWRLVLHKALLAGRHRC